MRKDTPCCRMETTTGGNCMKRQYTAHQSIGARDHSDAQARQNAAGNSRCTGIDKDTNWVRRYNREPELSIPKKRGRPRKTPPTKQREMELRIKKLEREVTLYRSFLQAAGRMYGRNSNMQPLKQTKRTTRLCSYVASSRYLAVGITHEESKETDRIGICQ